MAWTFFADGAYYERNVAHWLETLLMRVRRRVFYDVGANYGYFSLLLARRAKRVHAFEPVSATRRVLERNIRANRLKNVRIHPLGLSNQSGMAEINLYGCSGKNSLFAMRHVRGPHLGTERIRLTRLDDLFASGALLPPDLIKIDIEGGELAALQGARAVIDRFQPALLLEYLDWQFRDAGYRRRDLLRELERGHYAVYGIPEDFTDNKVYPIAKTGRRRIASIIALPQGREALIAG